MGPATGGMMEGFLVSNIPFLGDFLDPPLTQGQTDGQKMPAYPPSIILRNGKEPSNVITH